MKKKIFTLLALFAGVLGAYAENEVTVSEALVPSGKSGSFSIELSNPGDAFCAFQMDLKLPTGITFVSATKSARFTAQSLGNAAQGGNVIRFTSVDTEHNENYLEESGALFTVTVKDESGEAVGTKLAAQLLNMEFTRKDESAFKPDAVDFNIEISDKVILDENSTVLPAAQEDKGTVLVKRTLKKDVWSTICLPFAVSNAKLIEAFGDDVIVAQAKAISQDGSKFVVSFSKRSTAAIPANTPQIIKVSKDIESFTIADVKITPNAAANVEILDADEIETMGYFYGTQNAGVTIPKDNLFISGNNFYYSKGTTTIKGFRGYFKINGFDSSASAPEIDFVVDGEATKIDGLNVMFDDGQYYNLKGQKVDNPTEKGVYIKNGKKVVIK